MRVGLVEYTSDPSLTFDSMGMYIVRGRSGVRASFGSDLISNDNLIASSAPFCRLSSGSTITPCLPRWFGSLRSSRSGVSVVGFTVYTAGPASCCRASSARACLLKAGDVKPPACIAASESAILTLYSILAPAFAACSIYACMISTTLSWTAFVYSDTSTVGSGSRGLAKLVSGMTQCTYLREGSWLPIV